MVALLHHLAPVEHEDAVGHAHGREAVADDDRHAALGAGAELLEQARLGLGIHGRRGLVEYEEILGFREIGACGTATVVAPIASITRGEKKYEWSSHETLLSLRDELNAIQFGEAEDKHGWMKEVAV